MFSDQDQCTGDEINWLLCFYGWHAGRTRPTPCLFPAKHLTKTSLLRLSAMDSSTSINITFHVRIIDINVCVILGSLFPIESGMFNVIDLVWLNLSLNIACLICSATSRTIQNYYENSSRIVDTLRGNIWIRILLNDLRGLLYRGLTPAGMTKLATAARGLGCS